MDNKERFNYTYSAKEQREIENIRKKYVPREEDKMETLFRLDREVTRRATVWALSIGIIGTLIMGTGMCLVMVWEMFAIGIAVGVIGIALAALAHPIYKKIIKKERDRIAPEIIRLTDELLK